VTGVAVIVGPASVRSSCGAISDVTDWATAALTNIDDEFAFVDDQPVAAAALWRGLFESLRDRGSVVLVCPSWWSDRRVDAVAEAAQAAIDEVTVVRRAPLLASTAVRQPSIVVEVAESFVTVAPSPDLLPVHTVPMRNEPVAVVDDIVRQLPPIGSGSVVVDRPDGLSGAAEVAALLHDRLRSDGRTVVIVDDDRLLLAAEPDVKATNELPAPYTRCSTWRRAARKLTVAGTAAALGLVVVAVVAASGTRSSAPRTTLLIEGRVAVEVPASWKARRITAGPGSPRLQVSSPDDSQAAVHVTQSAAARGETLEMTADTLRRAMKAQPPDVFVDFNADDRRGSRPAVTYREVRADHDVRWTVLLDGGLRISVGCQTGRGREDTVAAVCAQAIASVRDVGEFAGTVGAQR